MSRPEGQPSLRPCSVESVVFGFSCVSVVSPVPSTRSAARPYGSSRLRLAIDAPWELRWRGYRYPLRGDQGCLRRGVQVAVLVGIGNPRWRGPTLYCGPGTLLRLVFRASI